ncbi:MAG: GC-type dockerin domain-anchored protein [Planctomycetota bacterium]
MLNLSSRVLSACALAALACSPAAAGVGVLERCVQITSVDFTTGVIELRNLAATDVDLSGWRWCSHDEDQVRRYTAPGGLNGVTIPAGQSLFFHTLNDAALPGEINISGLNGSFALPFDSGAYGLGIFAPINGGLNFGSPEDYIDHLQWSIDGIDNTSADDRSDEAENAGLWTDQGLWISTTAETERIELADLAGTELHSPAAYTVVEPCPADLAAPIGSLDFFDVLAYLAQFDAQDPAADLAAPIGSFDFFDVLEYLAQFDAGC